MFNNSINKCLQKSKYTLTYNFHQIKAQDVKLYAQRNLYASLSTSLGPQGERERERARYTVTAQDGRAKMISSVPV